MLKLTWAPRLFFCDFITSSALSKVLGIVMSIFIPCHRIIGTNGTLTGYGGGLDVKEKLLKLESKEEGK